MMAKASFVVSGIASGISNLFDILADEKTLSQAMADTGLDAVKGGARGGAVGIISTGIRYKGLKTGNALLSDSTMATVMANGMVLVGKLPFVLPSVGYMAKC